MSRPSHFMVTRDQMEYWQQQLPMLREANQALTDERDRLRAALTAYVATPDRPEDDADQLLAVADWLDTVDDALGIPVIEREVQDDLRRMADALRAALEGES